MGQVAETGEQTTNDNLFPADPHGIGMHNALWASMASMGAMSSAVWWWDNWVAPNNLCTHRSMGAFALPLTIRSLYQEACSPEQVPPLHCGAQVRGQCRVAFVRLAAGWARRPSTVHRHQPRLTRPPKVTTPQLNESPRLRHSFVGHLTRRCRYSCAFQKKAGKCDGGRNSSWMLGKCCHTCHPDSVPLPANPCVAFSASVFVSLCLCLCLSVRVFARARASLALSLLQCICVLRSR